MKSIRCFNRGFITFASIGSLKSSISCIAFVFIILTSQSVRSDVVTVYEFRDAAYPNSVGTGNLGNSFYTTLSNTKVKTISLYLETGGASATGTATVNIYNTTGGSNNYIPTGSSLASSTYILNNTTLAEKTLTAFDFTGINAISLNSNTRYAFMLSFAASAGELKGYYGFKNDDGTDNNLIMNNSAFGGFAMAGTVEVETTAVPEPGTLILTGSALLAGAIGVYFTRRHRDQALTPAAV